MSKKEEKKMKNEAAKDAQKSVGQPSAKDASAVESAKAEEDGANEEGAVNEQDPGPVQEAAVADQIDSKKKDPKDALIDELQDKVKRQMAEFDNYRKRTEKEKSAMFELGASDVIKRLLPIVDNFERGFKSVEEEDLDTPFAKGMDMVYKQTIKMLEEIDVKPIEAVGAEFNPELHNAVMHVEDEEAGESVIVEEFEKGYTYRDTVIRHSMVKVAN